MSYVVRFFLVSKMSCYCLSLLLFLYTPGHEVNLNDVLDPHTVAGLLKLHFREQKASILPRGPPLTILMEHVRNRDVSHLLRSEGGGVSATWVWLIIIFMQLF